MKKFFFFFILFLFPILVSASSIKKLEVLNGTLSREFESSNNIYSITLKEGESKPIFSYELEEETSKVEEVQSVMEGNMITNLEVTNDLGEKEIYTFYINKMEEETPVFKEINSNNVKEKEIPNLKYYVGIACFLIILILFKVLVLGFKKRKKK